MKATPLATLWRDVHTGDHRVVFLNFSDDQAVKAWLVKVQSACICLHSAFARSISKPTIWLLASSDSNGGYVAETLKIDFIGSRCACGKRCQCAARTNFSL